MNAKVLESPDRTNDEFNISVTTIIENNVAGVFEAPDGRVWIFSGMTSMLASGYDAAFPITISAGGEVESIELTILDNLRFKKYDRPIAIEFSNN